MIPALLAAYACVAKSVVAADEPEHGREVDDRAAAGLAEARDRVLAAEEDALQVAVEDGVPACLRARRRSGRRRGRVPLIPAPLKTTSSRSGAAKIRATSGSCVRSPSSRSTPITVAPASSKARTTALPIPPAAPVTSATLPVHADSRARAAQPPRRSRARRGSGPRSTARIASCFASPPATATVRARRRPSSESASAGSGSSTEPSGPNTCTRT